jgi:hypothetical protein
MNDVMLRTEIVEILYDRRKAASGDVGAVEIIGLAGAVGASATRVALVCKSLVQHGHVDGDGNIMGIVRLSDAGVAYYEAITGLNE